MLTIEFNNQYAPQNSIDLDSAGNVCIEAINEEDGLYYYLLIKTLLGITDIFEYGPVIPDIDKLFDNYKVAFTRQPYNETKLKYFLNKWLNDKSKKITAAYQVNEELFKENYKNILDTLNKYSKEVY